MIWISQEFLGIDKYRVVICNLNAALAEKSHPWTEFFFNFGIHFLGIHLSLLIWPHTGLVTCRNFRSGAAVSHLPGEIIGCWVSTTVFNQLYGISLTPEDLFEQICNPGCGILTDLFFFFGQHHKKPVQSLVRDVLIQVKAHLVCERDGLNFIIYFLIITGKNLLDR